MATDPGGSEVSDFTDAELTDALLDLCAEGKLKMVPDASGEWQFVAVARATPGGI